MLKREDGFSIVELMVAMVVFVMVIASASNVFLNMFTQFKQQSKISETSIQNIVGLEILRRDIEHAGYGLPWVIPLGVAYEEALAPPIGAAQSNDAPSDAPRGIVSGNNLAALFVAGSDYIVVKSLNAVSSNVAQRWTRLGAGDVKRNGLSGGVFANNDRVVVLAPGTTAGNQRTLVVDGGNNFNTAYAATANFAPTGLATNMVYGVDPNAMRMPFNRADFFISGVSVPSRCAAGTGVLVKGEVQHADGTLNLLPLLDCVADMQAVYRLDNDGDGAVDANLENINNPGVFDAPTIRNQLVEVRVYILAHEGQRDPNYTYPSGTIDVGEILDDGNFYGRLAFNVGGLTNGNQYRWQLYTLVMRPDTLR